MKRDAGTVIAADGTRLAYASWGQGPPLVLANGVSTSEFFWQKILPSWTERYRVVTWDYKGHGRSEPARTKVGTSIEAMADDLVRVMDGAGVSQAPVVGFSMGSQVAFEACRHAPQRFPAVVSLLGTAGRVFDTALWRIGGRAMEVTLKATPRRARRVLRDAMHVGLRLPWTHRAGRALGFFGDETEPDDIAAYIRHFGELDPSTVADIALAAGRHDASDVLGRLSVPLLIIAGERDVFAPVQHVSKAIHRAAPGSKLIILPDGTHSSLFGHADAIEQAIEDFLLEALPDRDWR